MLNLKSIGLSVGLFLLIISFLFFVGHQDIGNLLFFSGLLISIIFYLAILFGKVYLKLKFIWTIILIFAIVIQVIIKPFLIKTSYLVYLYNNKSVLNETNILLESKTENFIRLNVNNVNDQNNNLFSTIEKNRMAQFMQQLGTNTIIKTDNGIYYEIGGFLRFRTGMTYCTNKITPNNRYHHLIEKWYFEENVSKY